MIETTSNPLAIKDLIADSLPDPIPFTETCTFSIPNFLATRTMASATLEAAKGVAFFVPLKPMLPELTHPKIFPWRSDKEIMVLL